jgi:hypothetical protein
MPSRTFSAVHLAPAVFAVALSAGHAHAVCSASALQAVHAELRAATAPLCGFRTLRRAFSHARNRAAVVAARAARECAHAKTPDVGSAHRALTRVLSKAVGSGAAGKLASDCALAYETELAALDADLAAAANGTESTTTTTSPPGTPTPPGSPSTTIPATCTTVSLEVDKGDCSSVTSEPSGLVSCGAQCDIRTFTVPAGRALRLKGTPAPGDGSVFFDSDCNDDGTVPLGDASPPDCSLSCDCTSIPK